MPLNELQKKYIKENTAHLIEILTEEKEQKQLANKVVSFQRAFLNQLVESDEMHVLQQCIYNSELYLRGVEKENKTITVGEIQHYLLKLVTDALENIAYHLNRTLTDLKWNHRAILSHLEKNNQYHKTFIPLLHPVRGDSEGPYEVDEPGRMFKFTLLPQPDFLCIDLCMTIKLDPIKQLTTYLADFPLYYRNADRFHAFIVDLKHNKGREKAESIASEVILDDLQKKKLISRDEGNSASKKAASLLTYQFYYQRILQKIMNFKQLYHINTIQFKTLTSPNIMQRIENKECSISTLKQLTAHERLIFIHPFYYQIFKESPAKFMDYFKGINEKESLNLICPAVCHLIELNIITIHQAKSITSYARLIISNETYYNLMKKNLLNIDSVKHADNILKEYLFDKYISGLIEQSDWINKKSIGYLLHPDMIHFFTKLIRKKKFQSGFVTPYTLKLLMINPYLRILISEEILEPHKLHWIWYNGFEYKFPSLEKQTDFKKLDKTQIKIVIDNFILLASHALLSDFELQYIYNNMETFCASFNELHAEKEQKNPAKRRFGLFCNSITSIVNENEEKMSPYSFNLLDDQHLSESIKININARLQALLSNHPEQINEEKLDSFECLISSCAQFGIDVNKIITQEIERRLRIQLLYGNNKIMDPVFLHQEKLTLTSEMITELCLGQRCIMLTQNNPYLIDNTKDTWEQIQSDINKMAEEHRISTVHIHHVIIKNFLNAIKDQIKDEFYENEAELPETYKSILATLSLATLNANKEKKDIQQLDCWKKALFKIINIAKEKISAPQQSSPKLYINKHTKKIRLANNIFTIPQTTDIHASNMKSLCEQICNFETLLLPAANTSSKSAYKCRACS